jgi:tRNA modification GTPase
VPNGVRVAIAGRANSGKSSIFNYLLDFERSIVTPAPGTTRDYIEERSLIGGASVTLIDTAGVRETDDPAEAEGVRRSIERIECSTVVVLVIDGSEPFHPEEGLLFDRVSGRAPLVVLSKNDLPLRLDPDALRALAVGSDVFALSTVTGAGFPDFIAALASRCKAAGETDGQSAYVPNLRHRDALARTALHLDAAALQARSPGGYLDRVALELQAALAALGEMTGQTATEEILERIFSRFCVGK